MSPNTFSPRSPSTPPPVSTPPRITVKRELRMPSGIDHGEPDLENGVNSVALDLAGRFWKSQRVMCLLTHTRSQLSKLYISTFNSWATDETQKDRSLQRPFSQVLYAMVQSMKILRVFDHGSKLSWRDNRRPTQSRDHGRRYDDRGHGSRYIVGGGRYDDRRDSGRHYDDRRYDDRGYDDRGHGSRYDDRGYDNRSNYGRRYDDRGYDDRRDYGRRYSDRRYDNRSHSHSRSPHRDFDGSSE